MKSFPQALRRLSFAALLLSFSPAARAADKADEWLKLLPEDALIVMVVKNVPEVIKDWDGSGVGRFLEDEAVKRWLAPAYKDGKAPWSGEGKENLDVAAGSILFAMMAKSGSDLEKSASNVVFITDITGKEAEHEKLMAKETEAALKKQPTAKASEEEIEGVKVHITADSKGKKTDWINSWAVVDGVALQTQQKATMEHFIHALKTGSSGGKPSSAIAGIGHLAEINGSVSDITLYADLDKAIALLNENLEKEASKPGKAPSPFPPQMFLTALGLEELHGIGLSLDLHDEASRIDFALLHDENAKGLLPAIMRGTSTDVPQPAFIPSDADAASVSRMSLGNAYDALMNGLQKLGPLAGMMTMQLTQMEQQAGMSLRNDLLGSIDDVLIEVQDIGSGTTSTGEPNISKLNAFKLKDAARFKAALETVKKMVGNGFGLFEESDFEGYTIYTLKPSTAGAQSTPGTNFSYTIADDYFIFSMSKPELMHRVLTRMKRPGGDSFWDAADVQQSLATLPKGATGIGAQRGGAIISAVAQVIGSAQAMSAKSKSKTASPKKSGPKGPSNGEEESSETEKITSDSWFDTKAVPSEEVFKKYFGTSAVGTYALPDAVHFRYLALPPAK